MVHDFVLYILYNTKSNVDIGIRDGKHGSYFPTLQPHCPSHPKKRTIALQIHKKSVFEPEKVGNSRALTVRP